MKHYIFYKRHILVKANENTLPEADTWNKLFESGSLEEIFSEEKYGYKTATLTSVNETLENFTLIRIRKYFSITSSKEGALCARAKSFLNWRKNFLFCPACGTKLLGSKISTARFCKVCKIEHFPRIEPCVIILVSRGDEILLARHKERNQNLHTCIAGFVELGESIEQAVAREVKEEVGIEIKNIKYVGSQHWPFPDQLMLAFKAEYKSGTIKVQEDELYEAKWFKRSSLPRIPQSGSIAHKLISGELD